MKLCVIYPLLNQHELSQAVIDVAIARADKNLALEILILDNASEPPFEYDNAQVPVKIVHLEKNIGVYPTFWEALKHTDADILAFFHNDLVLCENNWNERLLKAFDNPKVGLVGFIGSNEIDIAGGRGYGTTSNFQGMILQNKNALGNVTQWVGSPAKAHGAVNSGYSKAAVVDGCAMVFRRSVLELIKQRENFPPHHFYDRLLCCETLELGYEIGVLGIACDHISCQTASHEDAYNDTARTWAEAHNLPHSMHTDNKEINWDRTLYTEAERQFLKEYRDEKHFIPIKVLL